MILHFRRLSATVAALLLSASLVAPAFALDPLPTGHKERERHVFRDVQMGLRHPAPTGKSTTTPAAPIPLFPWLPPAADPNAAIGGTAAK